jgi:phosphatidylserine/phosphatidylglycerophosphate/cardiolipin synthase-like enzyme
MFLTALSLTLAALSPAVPVSSLSSGVAVAVCFSPEENCADFADRAIGNAEREILVGAYGLTNGSSIVEALIRAKERGIDVRLIADKNNSLRARQCRGTARRGGRTDLDR